MKRKNASAADKIIASSPPKIKSGRKMNVSEHRNMRLEPRDLQSYAGQPTPIVNSTRVSE